MVLHDFSLISRCCGAILSTPIYKLCDNQIIQQQKLATFWTLFVCYSWHQQLTGSLMPFNRKKNHDDLHVFFSSRAYESARPTNQTKNFTYNAHVLPRILRCRFNELCMCIECAHGAYTTSISFLSFSCLWFQLSIKMTRCFSVFVRLSYFGFLLVIDSINTFFSSLGRNSFILVSTWCNVRKKNDHMEMFRRAVKQIIYL